MHDIIPVIVLLASEAGAWQLSKLPLKQHDHPIDATLYRVPNAPGHACAKEGGMALYLKRLAQR